MEKRSEVEGVRIEAVPMYNNHRGPDEFVKALCTTKVTATATSWRSVAYASNSRAIPPRVPAMRSYALASIDVAFMTMNLPYTTPLEAAPPNAGRDRSSRKSSIRITTGART